MTTLIISDTIVKQDAEGRFSLNDLHRAAVANGAKSRTKEPAKFLASPQTIELITELETTHEAGSFPLNTIEGRNGGTYVAKELVYAYAMFCSPKFHLQVIRAYDALVNRIDPIPVLPNIEAQTLFVQKAAEILRLSETSRLRLLGNVAKNTGLPSNLLPDYSSEQLVRPLTILLKEHNSPLTAKRANLFLEDMGYLELLSRLSRKKSADGAEPGTRYFWSITEKGLRYGKNETSPQNPRETQPLWYVATFAELLAEIHDFSGLAKLPTHAAPEARQ